MQDASGFLKRFSQLLQKRKNIKHIIISVCKEVAGVDVTEDKLKIKGFTIVVNLGGSQRSQIFMKKQQIITEINKKAGEIVVTEIH